VLPIACFLCLRNRISWYKDNANREQYKKNHILFYCRVQLILSKDNANREQYKKNHILFYCRVQLILLQIEEDFYLL